MTVRSRTVSLALTAMLALAAVSGCGEDDSRAEDPTPVNGGSSGAADPGQGADPSEDPTADDPASSDDPGTEQTTVPVYLLGDTPIGPRLFREFHRVGADDPLARAAAVVTSGDPIDPDYRSPFPAGGELAAVTYDGGELVVELPDASWTERPAGMSRQEARLAVQALVYTLQGVQQERAPMRTVLDGEPAMLLGVDSGSGMQQAPQLDVLAFVNVTAPEEGATVSGTVHAHGVASSFEATVPWQVRDASGTVVKKGFSTAEGWMDKLYPWETEIDLSGLAPGEYTFVAMTDDPSGGEGGGPTEDTKTIVVQ
ncbi:Gmad2 immunoglobulin-like domain-containing protein [Nocardioides ferulae]|uniref:Gmad2 immunoglobulin-like domain-containing protein n=1 Tax=Nocardioides ferulae TaxID=2340821 RepID=UPI0013DD88C3|nr:Gmad2 immunoglobulin-like domain-containing protein [Nocardioides ferulae]